MSEQLLDGANIVAGFKQVGGKTVAKSMATGSFWYASGINSSLDCVLQVLFVDERKKRGQENILAFSFVKVGHLGDVHWHSHLQLARLKS